jgi:hypothetical protein
VKADGEAWWRERAACRDVDTSVFFRVGDVPELEAVEACDSCPVDVRAACLAYALDHGAYGYWAGTTEADRAALRAALAEGAA